MTTDQSTDAPKKTREGMGGVPLLLGLAAVLCSPFAGAGALYGMPSMAIGFGLAFGVLFGAALYLDTRPKADV